MAVAVAVYISIYQYISFQYISVCHFMCGILQLFLKFYLFACLYVNSHRVVVIFCSCGPDPLVLYSFHCN